MVSKMGYHASIRMAEVQHYAVEGSAQGRRVIETTPQSALYSIVERNGGFVAVLPSLISDERKAVLGRREESFPTREAAEAVIMKSREATRVRFELAELRKTFTSTYYSIEPKADGGFLVKIPANYKSERGMLIGTATVECKTWDEAKALYLKERKDSERLTHEPILDVRLSPRASVAFSHFDGFRPNTVPGAEVVPIPAEVQKVLMTPEQMKGGKSALSYHKTLERPGWENELYGLVDGYLKGAGQLLMQELGITSLDALTPKQAIDVSTRLVLDLTKYYVRKDLYFDVKETKHDHKDAIEILQEGQARKGDPTWEGNGVCRNFAGTVKAVFEALKARQGQFTQLNNVHCLYEGRTDSFEPTKENWMDTRAESKIGHAWNTFVALNAEGGAHAVIADVTWAKRDLQTGKIDHLDQTLTRMEPFIAQGLEVAARSGLAQAEVVAEREKALSYYLLQIERLSTSSVGYEKEQLPFFAGRCVELLARVGELKRPLSLHALQAVESLYLKTANKMDKSELEGLWHIYRQNRRLAFPQMLRTFLTEGVGGMSRDRLTFKDDELQAFVYDAAPDRNKVMELVSKDGAFRARMREVQPGMFGRFDPVDVPEDAMELKYLLKQDPVTESLASRIQPGQLDAAGIASIMERVRGDLKRTNPDMYTSQMASLSDYQIVKRSRELRKIASYKS